MSPKISEQAVVLGARSSLVGILARAVAAPTDRPAIVILNTGIIHRVGFHRMYVTMSRALASAGYTALRFDFSGIGDSDPKADAMSPLESCMADIREVLDWLESTRGISRFVLMGFCAGADHAVQYSHTDGRVIGMVLLDPTIPKTARYMAHYLVFRLMDLPSWGLFFSGRSRMMSLSWRWLRRRLAVGPTARQKTPPGGRGAGEADYRLAVARGLAILAAFTGERTRQTYREQMIDAFPTVKFGEQLQLAFFPHSDHSFDREADRAELTGLILRWMDVLQ